MGLSSIDAGADLLLLLTTCGHVLLTPFTKVEESFNLQAVHDICHYRLDTKKYDHLEFPGVVPRTFTGALSIALPACPIIWAAEAARAQKLLGLLITRFVLGGFSVLGLIWLKRTIRSTLGASVSRAFVLIACCQFHLLFYASRTLPNTFALPLISVAAAEWMARRYSNVISILAFTSALVGGKALILPHMISAPCSYSVAATLIGRDNLVVRCDLLPFAALLGLLMLLNKEISLKHACVRGGISAAFSLFLTIPIDSFFWQRWVWPEGSVLWFNTAENRSSEWGTQPVHWYFSSALPRAMLGALPLAIFGFWQERRVWALTSVTLGFIALYSLLPHKELRFILPVLPLLNIPAAAGLVALWRGRRKSAGRLLLFIAATAMMAGSLALTALFTAISRHNYPGGHALERLHALQCALESEGGFVHIDVLPAMTGVSRFGERGLPWMYSKEEDIGLEQLQHRKITHLLSSESYVPGFERVEAIPGFSHIAIHHSFNELWSSLKKLALPLKISLKDQVFLHRRALALQG